MTKVAALDYGMQGIRVNSVGPGTIITEMLAPMFESEQGKDFLKMLEARHALKRAAQPEEVAELILWLASDKASFTTGAFYPVDGGWTAH